MEQYSVEAVLSAVDKGFTSTLEKAGNAVNKLQSGTSKVTSSIVGSYKKMAVGVGAAMLGTGGLVATSVATAGEMRATEAQFEQVFKGVESKATEALQGIAKETSILPSRMKPAFNQIAAFAKVAGREAPEALSFTERAMRAAADTSAYWDKSLEQVTDDLKSYLKGNFNVADNLGILSTETTRNAKAMELFGQKYKDLKGVQQQEVLLKMYEEANKLSGALGQASREADGFENVMGNFKGKFKEIRNAIAAPLLDGFLGGIKKATQIMGALAPKMEIFYAALAKTNVGQGLINAFKQIGNGADKLLSIINGLNENSFAGLDKMAASLGAVLAIFPLLNVANKGLSKLPIAFELGSKAAGKFKSVTFGAFDGLKKGAGAVGGLASKIPGVSSAISSLGGKFTSIFTPATAAIEGIANRFPLIAKSAGWAEKGIVGFGKNSLSMATQTSGAIAKLAKIGLQLVGPVAVFGALIAALGLANNAFGAQIGQMINTAVTQGPQIITNLANGIISQIPGLIQSGVQVIQGLGNAIAVNLPVLVQKGVEIIVTLAQGVSAAMPQLIATSIQVITTVVNSIISAIPQLALAGMQVILSFVDGLMANMGNIITGANLIITNLANALNTYLPQIIDTGVQIIVNLITGMANNMPQILTTMLQVVQTIITALTNNLPKIIDGGIKIVKALITGIVQNASQILSAIGQLIGMIFKAIVDNGPQILKGGWEIIKFLGKGLAETGGELLKIAGELVMKVVNAIKDGVAKFGASVWDGFKKGLAKLNPFAKKEADEMVETVAEAGEKMGEATDSLAEDMGSDMEAAKEAVTEQADETAANVTQSFSQMNTDATGQFDLMSQNVSGSASTMNTKVTDFLGQMLGNVSSLTQQTTEVAQANTQPVGTFGDFYNSLNDDAKRYLGEYNAVVDLLTAETANQAFANTSEVKSMSEWWESLPEWTRNSLEKYGVTVDSLTQQAVDKGKANTEGAMSFADYYASLTPQAQAYLGEYNAVVDLMTAETGDTAFNNTSTVLSAADWYAKLPEWTRNSLAQYQSEVDTATANTANTAVANTAQVEQASFSYQNFAQGAINAISGLVGGVSTNTATAASTVTSNSQEVSNAQTYYETLRQASTSALQVMAGQITFIYTKLTGDVVHQSNKMATDTGTSYEGMKTNVISKLQSMLQVTQSKLVTIMSAWTSAMSKTNSVVSSAMSSVESRVSSAMSSVLSSMNSAAGGAYSAGYNTGLGFYNGLSGMAYSIYSLAASIASNVAATMRSALSIHSPSRVMEKIGGYTGEGFVIGLASNLSDVVETSKSLAMASMPVAMAGGGYIGSQTVSAHSSITGGGLVAKATQPLEVILQMGGSEWRAFVGDVTDTQQVNARLRRV